jgi:hypothetical protein
MSGDDMKTFLALVMENYRFTTSLDLEILGRMAADLSLVEAESILARVRESDVDPSRLSIPAFGARARALIDHRNTKPSTPRRLIDFVRQELGPECCDANGEEFDALSLVAKYFERCWEGLKDLPASHWRNRLRGMIRNQAKTALMEMEWEEGDADAVAAQIVEMPLEPAEARQL